MPTLPENVLQPTVQAIYALHTDKAKTESERCYLGWSQIGRPCKRALWYTFRLATHHAFEGRMLRLFDTGHREEERVLQELRGIGCEVWDRDPQTGKQFGCESLGGHLRGHLDAVVKGLPEAPKTAHLVDVKTCNDKKFAELVRDGMQKVYPSYYAQAQGYMGQFGLTRAMYIFVNKNTDQIHTERFEFDEPAYKALLERAREIVYSAEPPERLSEDPAWFECKFCEHRAICHGTQAPRVNCRTCLHSTPTESGAWRCERKEKTLSFQDQQAGCAEHRYIPAVLHWADAVDADAQKNTVSYRLKTGAEFVNGDPPLGYTSAEIQAAADKAALGMINDHQVVKLREKMDARIVK